MFRAVLKVVLAAVVFMSGSSSASAQAAFLTFGGSIVNVSQDASQRERLDSRGFGMEVGGSVPLGIFTAVSAGLGLDSHGFTRSGQTVDVLTPRLGFGVTTPGLYFNGEESKMILYFGADVGKEWLRDARLKGGSYIETHARIMFLEPKGHLLGVNVGWRVYQDGGSYTRRALLEAAWEF